MRQNRNQRRLCSADRDPSLRFFDPQRQENRSRTKFFSSLLVEAAGSDRHPYIQIPLGVGKLQQHRMFDFPSGPRRSRAIEDNFPPQAHIVRRP